VANNRIFDTKKKVLKSYSDGNDLIVYMSETDRYGQSETTRIRFKAQDLWTLAMDKVKNAMGVD